MRRIQSKGGLDQGKSGEFIPCLYMPHATSSSKLMIYFHGNAEDIGLATELLNFIREYLKVSGFLHV